MVRFLVHASLLSGVSLVSYLIGSNIERNNILNQLKTYNLDLENFIDGNSKINKKPGLPIFGTVSAATPFSDTSHPTRISQIMKYGFPGLDNVRSFDDYVLSYDRRNKVAHWVFEHLTKETVKHNDEVDRSKCEFTEDKSIHPYFRSTNADYKGSGYDRGHLAAAGNHKYDQKHVEQTFFLSNMAPQVGNGFNRHSWNRLERYVRKLTSRYPNVYCCTGPLYLPKKDADGKTYIKYEVIGANSVAVPTHFYKIVVCETSDNNIEMEAYVMPNAVIDDNTPLEVFQVPPESIERAAGLLFFDKMTQTRLVRINKKAIK
uniref:Endonuclease n=1 Tax=Xenopsylla cheopis TaxID=163159 RepID=A0A6M2DV22_XENCH